MKKAIIGKKVGMTQIFEESGRLIPVTVIQAGPCSVIQMKTVENEGYAAVQFGFSDIKENKANKPQSGHFKKAETAPKKVLKEFRLNDCSSYKIGDVITADIFTQGEKVDVTGVSKGKGFAGVIKRWGHSRGRMSHGSRFHRAPGSIGACSSPARVLKGTKLPGHMGNERITVQNLAVVKVMTDKNLLLVKGAVPGPKGGFVIIKDSVKK